MITLQNLQDTSRPRKTSRRVGRGIGSGAGVTCGRGSKGQGARSGYKKRFGKEGGNVPLFKKLPTRGFSNIRFQKKYDVVNLEQIEGLYNDGEIVNSETLSEKGFLNGKTHGIKLLGNGNLTKKVSFELEAISEGARAKLQSAKVPFTIKGETKE